MHLQGCHIVVKVHMKIFVFESVLIIIYQVIKITADLNFLRPSEHLPVWCSGRNSLALSQ